MSVDFRAIEYGLLALATLAAFLLGAWAFRRRRHTIEDVAPRRKVEDDARDPFKRWVQSVFLLVTRDVDYAYLSRAEGKFLLREWWDIHGRGAYEQNLTSLQASRSSDQAWDLVRFILLSRIGVSAGYRKNDESWAEIRPIARRLQAAYPGWSAMAQAYVHARRQWSELPLDGSADDGSMLWILANLAELRRERWLSTPYDVEFGGGSP